MQPPGIVFDCFRKLDAFFRAVFSQRPSSFLLLWRDAVHSLALRKNFIRFLVATYQEKKGKKRKMFFCWADCEHLNGECLLEEKNSPLVSLSKPRALCNELCDLC